MRYGNGSVVDSFDVITREEFAESAFFQNFLAPWGIDRLVGVLLDRRGGERLGLMLPGPGDRDVESAQARPARPRPAYPARDADQRSVSPASNSLRAPHAPRPISRPSRSSASTIS